MKYLAFLIYMTVIILNVAGCGLGSDDVKTTVTLNGYAFNASSAALISTYFPGKAGDVLRFRGFSTMIRYSHEKSMTLHGKQHRVVQNQIPP